MNQTFKTFKDKLSKLKDDYYALVSAEGKAQIREHIERLFVEVPELQGVRWTQYTPHFADGDPCIFGFGHMDFLIGDEQARRTREIGFAQEELDRARVALNKSEDYLRDSNLRYVLALEEKISRLKNHENPAEDLGYDEDSEGWTDYGWNLGKWNEKLGAYEQITAYTAHTIEKCNEFELNISSLDDALEIVFGDHVRVSFMRGDDDFSIDEYEHD